MVIFIAKLINLIVLNFRALLRMLEAPDFLESLNVQNSCKVNMERMAVSQLKAAERRYGKPTLSVNKKRSPSFTPMPLPPTRPNLTMRLNSPDVLIR